MGLLVSFKCLMCSHTHRKRRMGSSFGFSRCFTIILGGLGLYKPSAPGLNVECPNPLNGPRFG